MMNQGNLLQNGQLNFLAENCVSHMFDKNSTNGNMTKDNARRFIQICIGFCPQEKLKKFMEENDPDSKGFITKETFVSFYRKSAKDRPFTVLKNFQMFGVKGFYQIDEDQIIEFVSLRDYLCKSSQTVRVFE